MKTPISVLTAWSVALALVPQLTAAETSAPVEGGGAEPIAWRTWSDDVFLEAQRLGRPVLLNLATAGCHECRLMSDFTYADPAVAEVVNEFFLPLKVDRDRFPQVAARYDAAMRAIRQTSNDPMTAFLTDQGQMFVAGSYFGAKDTDAGFAGLKTLALHVSRQYNDDPSEYHETAGEVANLVGQQFAQSELTGKIDGLPRTIVRAMQGALNHEYGSFGKGEQRPQVQAILLALEVAAHPSRPMTTFSIQTLNGLADGGLRDLLGGGFHEAALDEKFRLPRFAKTLPVNSGLLEAFAVGAKVVENPRFERVADDTLNYILGTLSDPNGGLYTAQAADVVAGDHGSAYTWTDAQFRAALSDAAFSAASRYFDIVPSRDERPEAEPAMVLVSRRSDLPIASRATERIVKADADAVASAVTELRQAAASRPKPAVDQTMYTSMNGAAAHSLLVAGALLERPEASAQALRTLDLFLERAWNDETGFARGIRGGTPFGEGLLEDQVQMAFALLAGYERTGERRYLTRALSALDLAWTRFEDPGHGGLLDIGPEARSNALFKQLRLHPIRDGVMAAANPVAVVAQERAGRIVADPSRIAKARKVAEAFAGSADALGLEGASLARASLRFLDTPPSVVVVAKPGSKSGIALAEVALTTRVAGVTVSWVDSWEAVADVVPAARRSKAQASEGAGAVVFAAGDVVIGATSDAKELTELLLGEFRAIVGEAPADSGSVPAADGGASGGPGIRLEDLNRIGRDKQKAGTDKAIEDKREDDGTAHQEPKPTPRPKPENKPKQPARKAGSDDGP